MRIWHHRHAGPLLTVWAVAIAVVAALYYAESTQPALQEMMRPLYFIVAAVLLFTTWRWFRGRSAHDRRHGDRRHTDRRGTDHDGPNNHAPDVPGAPSA